MNPRIENWSIYRNRLVGNVFGHPRYDDGERIITEPIVKIDEAKGEVFTKTRTYSLGLPILVTGKTPDEVSGKIL